MEKDSLKEHGEVATLENIFDYFLGKNWSKKEVRGKSVDGLFEIDGLPLTWFYKRFLVLHVLPPFLGIRPILTKMLLKQPLSFFDTFSSTISAYGLCVYVRINERIKRFVSKSSLPSKIPKVLFLVPSNHLDSSGSAFRVSNMISTLRSEKKISPLVMVFDPLSLHSYKKLRHYDTSIYGYIDAHVLRSARMASRDLSRMWKRLDDSTKHDIFTYGETSLWSYLRPIINLFFSRTFIFYQILYYECMKRVIAQEQVRAVVLTSQNSIFEKAALAAAEKMAIPTIIVQHGLSEGAVNPDILSRTIVSVFSEMYKKRLVRVGVPSKSIRVTGPVIFDDIFHFLTEEIAHDKKKILVITEPFVERSTLNSDFYFTYIERLLTDLHKIEHSTVTLRLHPSERFAHSYDRLIRKLGYTNITVDQQVGSRYLYKIIASSDVVINFWSTVAIEAMILDKPVVTVDLVHHSSGNYEILRQLGAMVVVDSTSEMSSVVKSLLAHDTLRSERRRAVRHICGVIDGKAYRRLVELLYDLTSAK